MLAGSIYYIAKKKCSFNVERTFWNWCFAPIWCASLTLAIATIVIDSLDSNDAMYACLLTYYTLRLVSILFNVIVYTLIWHKLKELGISGNPDEQGNIHPLHVLSTRLIYYPVIQVVSRLGATWYEAAYVIDSHPYNSSSSSLQTISLFCFAILTPIAGILYLAAFLYLQPKAYAYMMDNMCCWSYSRNRANSVDSIYTSDGPSSSITSITQTLVTVDARNNFKAVQYLDENELVVEIERCFSNEATVVWPIGIQAM